MLLLLFALALAVPLAQELPQPNDDYGALVNAGAEAGAAYIPRCEWGFRKVGNGWVMAQRQPLYPLCVQDEGGKWK